MQITTFSSGNTTIAAFDGRLDAATSTEAEQKLLGMIGTGALVADLERVSYMSSAGLRLLLKAAKQAKVAGIAFCVCSLQPAVREVFEISGFENVIPAYPDRAVAVGSV